MKWLWTWTLGLSLLVACSVDTDDDITIAPASEGGERSQAERCGQHPRLANQTELPRYLCPCVGDSDCGFGHQCRAVTSCTCGPPRGPLLSGEPVPDSGVLANYADAPIFFDLLCSYLTERSDLLSCSEQAVADDIWLLALALEGYRYFFEAPCIASWPFYHEDLHPRIMEGIASGQLEAFRTEVDFATVVERLLEEPALVELFAKQSPIGQRIYDDSFWETLSYDLRDFPVGWLPLHVFKESPDECDCSDEADMRCVLSSEPCTTSSDCPTGWLCTESRERIVGIFDDLELSCEPQGSDVVVCSTPEEDFSAAVQEVTDLCEEQGGVCIPPATDFEEARRGAGQTAPAH